MAEERDLERLGASLSLQVSGKGAAHCRRKSQIRPNTAARHLPDPTGQRIHRIWHTAQVAPVLTENNRMPPHELRPLIAATLLMAVALAVRGVPAGEPSLTFQNVCEQLLRAEPNATAPAYSPCMPPP